MNPQMGDFRSSPAHVLAEFSRKALSENLPNTSASPPSKAVIGNFSYICRQLYSTCEGLLVMNHYDLISSIAAAWRQASLQKFLNGQEYFVHSVLANIFSWTEVMWGLDLFQACRDVDQAATPTPSIDGDSAPNTARESQYM